MRLLQLCLVLLVPCMALAQKQSTLPASATFRGVYATIDVKGMDELVRRLNSPRATEHNPAEREVLKDPASYMPPVLYALGNALSVDAGRGEIAIFWYHVGRLRAVYDSRRCRDATALGIVPALGKTLSADLIKLQYYQRDRLPPIAAKAVEWDKSNPRNYDQRWACLAGKVAASSPGTDPNEVQVPETEWPAILQRIHETHLRAVSDFAAEKKGG